MNVKDPIRTTLAMSEMILGGYIADLTDSDLLVRAVPGMNPIAWQLGHLISSERGMMEKIVPGSCPALPEGFDEFHGRDRATSDDASGYLSLAKYQELMTAQRAATKQILESIPESDLDHAGEGFPPYAPTYGAMLNMVGIHGLMHAGQFVAVRRMLGKPVTI
jgi:hypothetical protein